MSQITVQRFCIERLDECVDLYMKTYSREPWHESWESRDVVSNFIQNHYKNNYFIGFLALKNNKVVGVSLGFEKPWIKGMEYYIDEFFVDVDLHRQGIGTAFMARIKEEMVRCDIHAIILSTEKGYPSQLFYEKIGFHVEDSMVVLDISF